MHGTGMSRSTPPAGSVWSEPQDQTTLVWTVDNDVPPFMMSESLAMSFTSGSASQDFETHPHPATHLEIAGKLAGFRFTTGGPAAVARNVG
jgi:hypothetical protein